MAKIFFAPKFGGLALLAVVCTALPVQQQDQAVLSAMNVYHQMDNMALNVGEDAAGIASGLDKVVNDIKADEKGTQTVDVVKELEEFKEGVLAKMNADGAKAAALLQKFQPVAAKAEKAVPGLDKAYESLQAALKTSQKDYNDIIQQSKTLTKSIQNHKDQYDDMKGPMKKVPGWAKREEKEVAAVSNDFKDMNKKLSAAAAKGEALH